MGDDQKKVIAKVGNTEVDVSKAVRDIRGIEDLVKESVETTWTENVINQMKVWLTPYPHAHDIAEWDRFLLERYPPLYTATIKECQDCFQGPCNLEKGKGSCGLDLETFQAKLSLQSACKGLAMHLSTCKELLDHCIKEFGKDKEIKWGNNIVYGLMNVNILISDSPKNLGEVREALTYAEGQLSELLTAANVGRESSVTDLESKVFHAGSVLLFVMDLTEWLKYNFFDFAWGPDKDLMDIPAFPPPTTEGGLGSVDTSKPVLVFMGNDFLPAWMAVKYMKDNGIEGKIEVTGIGSTGHDMIRFYDKAKVLTSPTRANKVLRLGMGDVIVLSDICCKVDVMEEAIKTDTRVITTSFNHTYGLDDRALDSVDEIVNDLEKGTPIVMISDPRKAGEVAVKLAQKMKGKRKDSYLLTAEDIKRYASKCTDCDACSRACPASLINCEALKAAKEGDFTRLADVHEKSMYCGKCEQACPEGIPLMDMFLSANPQAIKEDYFKMRAGRGPITNLEVRDIAITMFSMPSAVAIIGCGNYPGAESEVAEMAREFVQSNYSVAVAGCIAQDVARYKDPKTGKFLFEAYPALYNPRCLTNCGGCSAQSLVSTAPYYKLGYVAFRNPYKSTLAQEADFIYRFASVVIMWGPATDLAYAVAAAHARAGIPVIVGPNGSKFKRYLLGNKYDRSKWWGLHGNTGEKRETEPTPEHLLIPVETIDEAIALVPKLSFTTQEMDVSRQNKFDLYLNAYKKRFGEWPDDWHLFVKKEAELPITKKAKIIRLLEEEHGWEVDKKRGRILKAKHRDGRLMEPGDFVENYGFRPGQYLTGLSRFVYKPRSDREK
ncbi:MAG: hypothetical protein COW04_01925 [Deltaproteobacteria bacterium CG12_big_fil_rev_8_21_14_0_65_43_10]|nr:MAG: hypothetical protein COW04_01925 [Deltaproteobacteria bacterium CG12_big_fil_rev_8_21_14_0_65_43_10]PIU84851.1 MAG: hypothetical protein COS67_10980 [Deltaproteobacteria bacterium CG06_land_8_20_14_3_00_44_19]PIZ20999.1 MAG: hypothetical protein COY50_01745 [Deltaproteobacteria bacterium CG_4_10_14_0_8_um_filter_43_12]PJB39756.1 MAG: hypothetical protein CO106_10440 [Deltaproteobacteria bacterium CG_4_9_14_3_um_filter_44_9]